MIAPEHPHPPAALRARLLVLGYGNTLFGDDGLGQLIAQHVADWAVPGVLALARHELTPELAADLATADDVIFVDAALSVDQVILLPVTPAGENAGSLNHALTPAALLALTTVVFGRTPQAWQLIVPGADFAPGSPLSPLAQTGITRALEIIRQRL